MTDATYEDLETLCVPSTHPCLPGHFPGQPVVPGVLMLDHIASCLQKHKGIELQRIASVKFLAPLLPEERAMLQVRIEGIRVRFRLTRENIILVSGEGDFA